MTYTEAKEQIRDALMGEFAGQKLTPELKEAIKGRIIQILREWSESGRIHMQGPFEANLWEHGKNVLDFSFTFQVGK